MSCSQSHARKKYREFLKFHPGRSYYEWLVSRTFKRNRKKIVETITMVNPFYAKLCERGVEGKIL